MATSTKNTNDTVTNAATEAAEACCRSAADTFKAGVEANQKFFNTLTNNFAETCMRGWTPTNVNPFTAGVNPFAAGAATVPAAFEQMTQAMNTIVDANARFASECNSLLVDAMRANARTFERSGALMVNQLTGKTAKPAADAAREILDECTSFAKQVNERTAAMTSEHTRQVVQVMDQVLAAKCCKS